MRQSTTKRRRRAAAGARVVTASGSGARGHYDVDVSNEDIERFWNKVDRGDFDDCWDCHSYQSHNGYPRVWLGGRQHNAHRIAWMLTNGDIPDGLCVLHRCDRRTCCNPAHLFLGTYGDNARDRHAKGRSKNVFEHGPRHWNARLTETEVLQIRAMVARGVRQQDVADLFKINTSAVSLIASRKRWAHL